MARGLSLGEPPTFRFGLVFSLPFNALPPNPAKTQTRVPDDIDGNIDRTRGRRVARDASVNRRISEVGSLPVFLRNAAWIELRSALSLWNLPVLCDEDQAVSLLYVYTGGTGTAADDGLRSKQRSFSKNHAGVDAV